MTRTGTPGVCCDCGGNFPLPSRGRRLRCFACVKSRLGPRHTPFNFSVFESEWNAGAHVKDIAAKHDVALTTVYKAVRAAGATRARSYVLAPEVKSASDARAQQMVDARAAGMTLGQIGEIHGITRERTRQILARFGLNSSNSGLKRVIERRKQAKREGVIARRDKRCLRVYGCTYDSLEAILGADVSLTGNRAARAYVQQKKNAADRSIEFSLTFPQWWAVWQKSGKWEQRGRGHGYVMARTGDIGPYAVGNIYICTQSQNSKDSYIKTPASVRAAKRAANPNVRSLLGCGKGWAYVPSAGKKPYQVVVRAKYIGIFATPEEAHAAYVAECARIKAEEFGRAA